jgi:CubicO group peptidase (beta-lactamase class C family)
MTFLEILIDRLEESGPISGVAVGISVSGETVYLATQGHADLENNIPITEHTVFRIGSLTKQFTAVAILLLAVDGVLRLDDDMASLLLAYPALPKKVSVRHLLNHTSGIVNFTALAEHRRLQRLDATHEEVLALFAGRPLEFPPGRQYHYSNSGYYLLGMIIESVTGKRYADVLRERVFAPAGLMETHYLYHDPLIPNRARGYSRDGRAFLNAEPLSMHIPFSAGALGSSVTDLLRWQRALHHEHFLRPDVYRQLVTPPLLANGKQSIYGCGLKITDIGGKRRLWHGGSIPGFDACMAHYPDESVSIVVLCNTRQADAENIEKNLASQILGLEPQATPAVISDEDRSRLVM